MQTQIHAIDAFEPRIEGETVTVLGQGRHDKVILQHDNARPHTQCVPKITELYI